MQPRDRLMFNRRHVVDIDNLQNASDERNRYGLNEVLSGRKQPCQSFDTCDKVGDVQSGNYYYLVCHSCFSHPLFLPFRVSTRGHVPTALASVRTPGPGTRHGEGRVIKPTSKGGCGDERNQRGEGEGENMVVKSGVG